MNVIQQLIKYYLLIIEREHSDAKPDQWDDAVELYDIAKD